MKPYIKHDRWGDPVCCDCEHAFRDGERAMIVDNEVICWDCVEKWAEDDLADLLDHIASGEARFRGMPQKKKKQNARKKWR